MGCVWWGMQQHLTLCSWLRFYSSFLSGISSFLPIMKLNSFVSWSTHWSSIPVDSSSCTDELILVFQDQASNLWHLQGGPVPSSHWPWWGGWWQPLWAIIVLCSFSDFKELLPLSYMVHTIPAHSRATAACDSGKDSKLNHTLAIRKGTFTVMCLQIDRFESAAVQFSSFPEELRTFPLYFWIQRGSSLQDVHCVSKNHVLGQPKRAWGVVIGLHMISARFSSEFWDYTWGVGSIGIADGDGYVSPDSSIYRTYLVRDGWQQYQFCDNS